MGKSQYVPGGEVRVIVGTMGGGKSLYCCGRVLKIITEERRPVFTNLPFKFRVLRRWLTRAHGPEFANLIHPLTRRHFVAFIRRQEQKAQLRAAMRLDADRNGGVFREREFVARWGEQFGEDVVSGDDANWIHPASYLILDEVHHWFPMQDQSKPIDPDDKKSPAQSKFLQSYLTMCRHHGQNIWAVTQDDMQLDIAFRRLALTFTLCRDRSDDPVLWGLRYGHLGLKSLAAVTVSRGDWENKDNVDARVRPLSDETVFPGLPHNRWLFRLYESQTHVSSPRQMRRQLAATRAACGITQADDRIRRSQLEARKNRGAARVGFVAKVAVLASCSTLVGACAFVAGRSSSPPAPQVEQSQEERELPETLKVAEGKSLNGFGTDSVMIGADLVKQGGVWRGLRVEVVDRRDRSVLLNGDGVLWLWRVGSDPEPMGFLDRFRALADERIARIRADLGPANSDAPADP